MTRRVLYGCIGLEDLPVRRASAESSPGMGRREQVAGMDQPQRRAQDHQRQIHSTVDDTESDDQREVDRDDQRDVHRDGEQQRSGPVRRLASLASRMRVLLAHPC